MLKRVLPSREQDNQTTWCWQSEWKNGAYLHSIWGGGHCVGLEWVTSLDMLTLMIKTFEKGLPKTPSWGPSLDIIMNLSVRLQEVVLDNIITQSFVGGVNHSSTRCVVSPGVSSAEVWICPPATGFWGDLYGPGDPTVRAIFWFPVSTGYQITWLRWRLYPLAAT